MEPDIIWVYLAIFLMIPLARIIPRMLAKRKMAGRQTESFGERPQQARTSYTTQQTEPVPKTKNMLVLGAINKGAKTFGSIQKETGLESNQLEKILEELEKNEMLMVRQKQGVLGTKIEILPTDKGFKEYYS